jgi:hypothetical protein
VNRNIVVPVMLSLLVVLSILTFERNHLYRDPLLLWEDVASKAPSKRRAHKNYGHVLASRQSFGKVMEQLQAVLLLKEDGIIKDSDAQRDLSFIGASRCPGTHDVPWCSLSGQR